MPTARNGPVAAATAPSRWLRDGEVTRSGADFRACPMKTALDPPRPASKLSRANADPRRSEALKGDHTPDRLDDAKWPSSREKAIDAGKEAADGKGQDERPATSLERVHEQHEAEGQDAIDGNERHTPVWLRDGSRPDGSLGPQAHGPESAPRAWTRSPSLGEGSKLIVKGF